jgi:hypothetical protein
MGRQAAIMPRRMTLGKLGTHRQVVWTVFQKLIFLLRL